MCCYFQTEGHRRLRSTDSKTCVVIGGPTASLDTDVVLQQAHPKL